MLLKRGSWDQTRPEGHLPKRASSNITGETLLIRVREGDRLSAKVLGGEPTDSLTWGLGIG